jgi:anti-sigma regulatory factor (Ser/Thr protein kinase)/ActR/RegA family two-component response regulator
VRVSSQPRLSLIKTVLLIAPVEPIELVLVEVLDPREWAVQRVADNATGLTLLRKKSFDLIITSEKTSGREDVELLRKIRLAHPRTRLIILTPETTPTDVIDAIRARAFSYFTAPYSREAVSAMIESAVNQPAWDDGIDVVSATPEFVRLRARCDFVTAERVLQFFSEISELPELERQKVGMAFREMLLNAVEHGGQMDSTKQVEITYVRARQMVTCLIKDPGQGFTLDEIPHAAIANPDEDPLHHVRYREEQGMRPGGFGVLMAQQLVDQVIYGQDGNEVMLIKYLDPQSFQAA